MVCPDNIENNMLNCHMTSIVSSFLSGDYIRKRALCIFRHRGKLSPVWLFFLLSCYHPI